MGRLQTVAALCLLLLCATGHAAEGKKPSPVKPAETGVLMEKEFSVAAPEKGFSWAKAKDFDQGGVKGAYYLATKEGDTRKVLLIVTRVKLEKDAEKISNFKGFVGGVLQGAKDLGQKNLKVNPAAPPKPPVEKRLKAVVTGEDAEGKPAATEVTVIFGNFTYCFEGVASSTKEAEALSKVADTLKETSETPSEK